MIMKHKTLTHTHINMCVPIHLHTHTRTNIPTDTPRSSLKYGTEQLDSTEINLRWCHPAAACTLSLALASLTNTQIQLAEFVLSWDDIYSWAVCFSHLAPSSIAGRDTRKYWRVLKHFNCTPQVIPLLFHFVGTNEYMQQIVQIALPTQGLFYVVNWITKSHFMFIFESQRRPNPSKESLLCLYCGTHLLFCVCSAPQKPHNKRSFNVSVTKAFNCSSRRTI